MSSPPDTDPTHEDPTLASASEAIGGPSGRRMMPSWWWTPVRVVMAVAGVVWLLGMAHQVPCATKHWSDQETNYHYLCYSDVTYLYTSGGLAELQLPYTDSGGRYEDLKYPVVVGYFAYGTAWLTHALSGFPDLSTLRSITPDAVAAQPFVADQAGRFMALTAVLLGVASVAAAGFLAGAHRGRPWDALYYAAAPTVALAGLINFDVLAVLAVAWRCGRGRAGRPVARRGDDRSRRVRQALPAVPPRRTAGRRGPSRRDGPLAAGVGRGRRRLAGGRTSRRC